jgi:hypothetical protein
MKNTRAAETAFPLAWPEGTPRTPTLSRRKAQFKNYRERISTPIAMRRLEDSLQRLGAEQTILSSNLPRRMAHD